MNSQGTVPRFERVTLVLSGGGALGAYQAGAYAALEAAGFEPSWLAATGIGAVNAALIAGNPPRQRAARLRQFWHQTGRQLAAATGRGRWLWPFSGRAASVPGAFQAERLRPLLLELVDFTRLNCSATRISLAASHVATGSDVQFDNDTHVLGPDHILACAAAATSPVAVAGELHGGTVPVADAPLQLLLDGISPADTLCFIVDCFDAEPGRVRGSSRARQQIAAFRRRHDLRRALAHIGERLPPDLRADPEIAACLAQGATATMNLVRIVHECSPAGLAEKAADFAPSRLAQRWRAGERDMAASLARPAWLAPPPRRVGVVVHEMRGGTVPSRS